MTHFDLTYAFNENLSFTVSKVLDDDAEDTAEPKDEDAIFVVSYSLPIK